jgi:hypothetical protein
VDKRKHRVTRSYPTFSGGEKNLLLVDCRIGISSTALSPEKLCFCSSYNDTTGPHGGSQAARQIWRFFSSVSPPHTPVNKHHAPDARCHPEI